MPVTFTNSNSSVNAKAVDLCTSALYEITVLAGGETISGSDLPWALEKLQRLIDRFNAKQECIYNVTFSRFTVPTNTQPITIGPSGQFAMNQRPVKVVNAALILTNSNPANEIDIPILVADEDWWANQAIKKLTSTLFTAVYYSPDQPLGNLYFWPIPTQTNDVRLEVWTGLTQAVTSNTTISLPQGYWDAIVTSLAVDLWPSFWKDAPLSPSLRENQQRAMKAILDNNGGPPRIDTAGQGIPSHRARPGFNFLTGQPW